MPKSRKRRSQEGPMPAAGAGLIRFFADSSEGVKIGPVSVVVLSIALLIFVLLAQFGLFSIFGI
ncbi:MAG: preprotein translocase subunit Sec61beta [Promethearchaeota archaeon]